MKTVLPIVVAIVITTWAAPSRAPAQGETETPPAAEPELAAEEAPADAEPGLGLTQGRFALQVIHEVRAESFFDGPVTAQAAADKLASVGLAPDPKWDVEKELTRRNLETAYARLVALTEPKQKDDENDNGEGDEGDEDEDDDAGKMTIAELMEKIIEVVREALRTTTTERQPVSPSRPLWR